MLLWVHYLVCLGWILHPLNHRPPTHALSTQIGFCLGSCLAVKFPTGTALKHRPLAETLASFIIWNYLNPPGTGVTGLHIFSDRPRCYIYKSLGRRCCVVWVGLRCYLHDRWQWSGAEIWAKLCYSHVAFISFLYTNYFCLPLNMLLQNVHSWRFLHLFRWL